MIPSILAVLGIFALIAILYGGYHCDCIPVPSSSDFGDKLTYYIRICVFPCSVVLYLTIMAVAVKRGSSRVVNPLAGKEHKLMMQKNILANTLEQTLAFLMITLVLTTYLESAEMRIIPAYSALWVVGRFFFWLGYPSYRSFGMSFTLIPIPFFLGYIGYLMYTRGLMYGVPSSIGGVATGTQKSEL